jgi:undecaprenyl-diphosphatase
VHAVVALIAQLGLYVVALLAVCVWLTVPRSEKVAMAVEMVVGMAAVAILVRLAGALHTDPRPFVQNPSLHPWFSHSADNGFPSDHTAVAAVTSFVVSTRRLKAGAGLLMVTVLLAGARVLAHVHHVQDVVAGGLIGLVSAIVAALAWRAVRDAPPIRRVSRETTSPRSPAAP